MTFLLDHVLTLTQTLSSSAPLCSSAALMNCELLLETAVLRKSAVDSSNLNHLYRSRRRINHKCSGKVRLLQRRRFHSFSSIQPLRCLGEAKSELQLDGFSTDSDAPVKICVTRTLPPALTVSEAVEKMREEVAKMRPNLLNLASGVLRLQIALPPTLKAVNWLFSSESFPQFYFLANKMGGISPVDLPSGLLGVAGIGAAVHAKGSSPSSAARKLMRYLSVDSPLISAYGFTETLYNDKLHCVEHVSRSCCAVIPQIEVNEFEDCSIFAWTLAWDDSLLHSFDEAINSAEQELFRVISCIQDIGYPFDKSWYISSQSTMKDSDMVVLNGKLLERTASGGFNFLKEQLPKFFCAYFRPSAAGSQFRGICEGVHSVSQSANINALWASLIVEEFVRHGLTYFCIAPGSRSSPLAIAASAHKLTTCMSCYDERSLAFHGVGFARGSSMPAVVITSSGTAVSNLLPGVVEASQDFLPMILLTADRPPELHDCGANQAINQVNHFGEFVRHSFNLPAPTDEVLARTVLTSIDSAIYMATQPVPGPVHINCPFREPLESYPLDWAVECLKGLDSWFLSRTPFTKYYNMYNFSFCGEIYEVFKIIQNAERGILLIGGLLSEEETWAALSLAKQLLWPVAADIRSGLCMKKLNGAFSDMDVLPFIDNLDHVLISEAANIFLEPDAILQIGSRLTSKRICQFLEFHSPKSYILVDKHPYRHDHSHIVTHRVQSTVVKFAESMRKNQFSPKKEWSQLLMALDTAVSREISLQISLECSLTEPYVAHVMGDSLDENAALFIGNSMAIRDADMYAKGWVKSSPSTLLECLKDALPLRGIRIAGNRGASGIDGLLSTAVGFAVGCQKKVLCMIGDVSFLHDTNGLSILSQRIQRKPMTILVINNHGGAIFSLLPIAERTGSDILEKYFYTSHDISVKKLCEAHGLLHLHVHTKKGLQEALSSCQDLDRDCVIEVESSIRSNSSFHSILKWSAGWASQEALKIISPIKAPFLGPSSLLTIVKMEFSKYRIQLALPLTSSPRNTDGHSLNKEGYIVTLTLNDGSVGFGEVAPISIHRESLEDVEEQLRFLAHVIEGASAPRLLALLGGSFGSWFWKHLGVMPSSIFPSVRCGIETAVLLAQARQQGGLFGRGDSRKKRSGVPVCALVDCNGTPDEVAHLVSQMVAEGFRAVKVKAARRKDPREDAEVIKKIREKNGYQIDLRVDANRGWALEQAVLFGSCVKDCAIQYIEEPVQQEGDIIKFCEETNLPVALDETIDSIKGDYLNQLEKFIHPGIVAIVIKPSVVGGFENAALIARWAQGHGKTVVISSAFESSLSLATYALFSSYLERQADEICLAKGKEQSPAIAHGLGTYRWLNEDVSTEKISVSVGGDRHNTMEISIEAAANLLERFQVDRNTIINSFSGESVRDFKWTLEEAEYTCSIRVQEVVTSPCEAPERVCIFLHGFLGAGGDWVPIMKALSVNARCIAVDLPGHGESEISWKVVNEEERERSMSLELVGDILCKLLSHLTDKEVILVGYSLGARISLYMATKYKDKIEGTVMISGSPGIRVDSARRTRLAQDEARANYLSALGMECFLKTWYASDLWSSFRDHPNFQNIVRSRQEHGDPQALAQALYGLSAGKQGSLWEELKSFRKPILLVHGEKDPKFKKIAKKMLDEMRISPVNDDQDCFCSILEVPSSGHAVHLENPLPLINAVRKFMAQI
ncbi:2-oxoglutarate decarboxylase/hydro-lyase/magnesium ion-binding protein isoform X2 [Wolffia australiana]